MSGWAVVACALATAAAAAALTGCGADDGNAHVLIQKAGRAGCVSTTGTRGACARGTALVTPGSVVVSPNGKHVYVASEDRYRGGVAIFDRAANGKLTQKRGRAGCVSEAPAMRRRCMWATGVRAPRDLAVTPDGRNVYVAAASDAIAVFDRNRTSGELTQKRGRVGCVSSPGRDGRCAAGRGLNNPQAVAVSPDGASVYVTSFDDGALAIFDRNRRTGALKQKRGAAGCVADEFSDARGCRPAPLELGLEGRALTISPDGRHVYVGTALQIFDRRADGALTPSREGDANPVDDEVQAIVVSADGRDVYVAVSFSGLLIFDRDRRSGALTPKPGARGCVTARPTSGCMRATALAAPTGVSLSPDGRSLYASSGDNQGNALVIFDRDPADGTLTPKPRPKGCVSQSGSGGACARGRALREDSTTGEASRSDPHVNPTLEVTVSPDGRSVYLAGDTLAVFDRR